MAARGGQLSGDAGTDTLSYEFSNLGVNVNMSQLTAGLITVSGGHANGDLVPTISKCRRL